MDDMMHQTLLKKGAEASLFIVNWHGRQVVFKKRLPKGYRPKKLDQTIRAFRTVHEPQLISEAKKAGVPTPTIFQVDVENSTIVMQFLRGRQLKQLLGEFTSREREATFVRLGKLVGRLHGSGIIHGDLTTSNMILDPDGKIFFVDFGLGEKNTELEARGVDLHLLKRALQSTHYQFAEESFHAVLEGYGTVVGDAEAKNVLAKVREIERRGRYVEERRQNMPA